MRPHHEVESFVQKVKDFFGRHPAADNVALPTGHQFDLWDLAWVAEQFGDGASAQTEPMGYVKVTKGQKDDND